MRTFETPGPVLARVTCPVGEIVVATHDEPRTEVDVVALRDDEATLEAVGNTRVELLPRGDGHEVAVDVPTRSGSFFGREPRIRVDVRAPHGTSLSFDTASADVRADGRLGAVRGKTASGDVTIADAAEVQVKSASGDLRIGSVAGAAEVHSTSGDIRIGSVGGTLDASVVSGALRVDAAEAAGSVAAVSGDIELAAVSEGELSVRTVSGDVTVGVRQGSRVHVDVSTLSGDLKSDLELVDTPTDGDGPLVDVRGNTVSGDVRLRRAPANA